MKIVFIKMVLVFIGQKISFWKVIGNNVFGNIIMRGSKINYELDLFGFVSNF